MMKVGGERSKIQRVFFYAIEKKPMYILIGNFYVVVMANFAIYKIKTFTIS